MFQANQNAVSFLNIPAKAHFCFPFFTEIFVLDALQVSKQDEKLSHKKFF